MRLATITIFTMGLAALLALPATAAEEPIPITDPMLLERLGFEPEAKNVFATPQALRNILLSPAERAAAREAHLAAESQSTFGTSATGYSPVSGAEFYPQTDTSGDASYGFLVGGRFCESGNRFYRAQISSLPHGVKVDQARIWIYDEASGDDLSVSLIRTCQPSGAGDPTNVVLDSRSSSGMSGNQTLTLGACIPPSDPCPIDEDIDLEHCSYEFRVAFASAVVGNNCVGGSALRIQKARAEWKRQISPAPDTATFGDVPTGHLFFQQIEALAASGITAGCGGGDFCPNDPLTRGQMATFLAKALGLHWTDISQ